MNRNRFGEDGPVPYRTDRVYRVGSEWFFSVRKGTDHGPYATEEEAKAALVEYIGDQLLLENLPNAKPDTKK
ncbi:MAG: DUF6316 family protein [Gammaproteobacteria bacterium]|nr:DUF6316 family protein [Gammaproteobacteria bacterium]MDH5650533.1 DUF6316 family protein [Gammaproteobacteria bacterium]